MKPTNRKGNGLNICLAVTISVSLGACANVSGGSAGAGGEGGSSGAGSRSGGGTGGAGVCNNPDDPTCGNGGTGGGNCVPLTCQEAAAECGTIDDGCFGMLDCGNCPPNEVCGAGGISNVCGPTGNGGSSGGGTGGSGGGCVPIECASVGAQCGIIPDGCGSTVNCGGCSAPDTCGGGGIPNVCGSSGGGGSGGMSGGGTGGGGGGCLPVNCADVGAQCGIIPDDCGSTVDCGSCSAPDTCGGGGIPNVCGSSGGGGSGGSSGGMPGMCGAGTCNNLAPVRVFDASKGIGSACNAENALARDGQVAGLDYGGSMYGVIDGHNVSGCLGLDFSSVHDFDFITVRAASGGNACGVACGSGYCGTGDRMHVFRSTSDDYTSSSASFHYVTTVDITSTLTDIAIPLCGEGRYVMICRAGFGPARDDVLLDSVELCTR